MSKKTEHRNQRLKKKSAKGSQKVKGMAEVRTEKGLPKREKKEKGDAKTKTEGEQREKNKCGGTPRNPIDVSVRIPLIPAFI